MPTAPRTSENTLGCFEKGRFRHVAKPNVYMKLLVDTLPVLAAHIQGGNGDGTPGVRTLRVPIPPPYPLRTPTRLPARGSPARSSPPASIAR